MFCIIISEGGWMLMSKHKLSYLEVYGNHLVKCEKFDIITSGQTITRRRYKRVHSKLKETVLSLMNRKFVIWHHGNSFICVTKSWIYSKWRVYDSFSYYWSYFLVIIFIYRCDFLSLRIKLKKTSICQFFEWQWNW